MGLFSNLFGGSGGRAPGTFRARKEGGLMSSLGGALIGVLFVVFLSPLAAWYGESQNRAENFQTAIVVEAVSDESGYIVIEGDVTNDTPLSCPVDDSIPSADSDDMLVAEEDAMVVEETAANCLYVSTDTQDYTRTEKEVCGSPSADQTILYETVTECDEDGTNCEQCYQVEQYDWESVEQVSAFASASLGSYTVTPSEKTNVIGSKEMTVHEFEDSILDPFEGDRRYVYEYLESDQELLVAGFAEDGMIEASYEDNPFVFSTLSYQGTLEDLEAQDSTAKWGLRIASLVLMVLGMVMIFGPLTAMTNVLKVIPGLGKHLDKGFDSVIGFVAGLIGLVLWLIMWSAILVVKNIWVLVIVLLILIGGGVFLAIKKGQKKGHGASAPVEKSAEVPAEKPASPEDKS